MSEQTKSIFELDGFKHLAGQFEKRKAYFAKNWSYYKAENYKPSGMNSAMGMMVGNRIANAVRPLFTPIARAVNLDVALIPGDWSVVGGENEQLTELFEDSGWEVAGDLFVKFVVAMGEGAIYAVDDRENKRVVLQAVRPDTYLAVPTSRVDPRPKLAILIDQVGDVEHATVITPDSVAIYKDGELELPPYPNALGYVPLWVCVNDPGDGRGEPTFDDVRPSLDEVNQLATYLANIIKKHAEPQWAAFGAEAGDLEKSGDSVWFFPEGSDVKAVLAQVDFEGVLSFIKETKEEVKEGLPELALTKLVGVERVASATIELQMAEAVFKIRKLRKPIDMCLTRALRAVGGMGVGSYGSLATVTIDKKRPVISIDALTRLQLEQAGMGRDMQALALEREQQLLNTGE